MGSCNADGGGDCRVRGGLFMTTIGGDAREGHQGIYYLPFPMHSFFSMQVSGSARVAHCCAQYSFWNSRYLPDLG